MPIVIDAELHRFTQSEFGAIAYDVMNRAFEVRRELGPSFDEAIYQNAIAIGFPNARTEVAIEVAHRDFRKSYFIDLLVEGGGVFEIKTVETINRHHRAQLLNYLLLTDLRHSKLVNMRPERVEHEFVNSHVERSDRRTFTIDDVAWRAELTHARDLKDQVVEILRDWGTSLALPLYEEAVTYFLGGEAVVIQDVDVNFQSERIGRQKMRLVSPDSAFRITNLNRQREIQRFEQLLRRILVHTDLNMMHWINMQLHQVTFQTVTQESS